MKMPKTLAFKTQYTDSLKGPVMCFIRLKLTEAKRKRLTAIGSPMNFPLKLIQRCVEIYDGSLTKDAQSKYAIRKISLEDD